MSERKILCMLCGFKSRSCGTSHSITNLQEAWDEIEEHFIKEHEIENRPSVVYKSKIIIEEKEVSSIGV